MYFYDDKFRICPLHHGTIDEMTLFDTTPLPIGFGVDASVFHVIYKPEQVYHTRLFSLSWMAFRAGDFIIIIIIIRIIISIIIVSIIFIPVPKGDGFSFISPRRWGVV